MVIQLDDFSLIHGNLIETLSKIGVGVVYFLMNSSQTTLKHEGVADRLYHHGTNMNMSLKFSQKNILIHCNAATRGSTNKADRL